jgi:hypothetical protein
MKLAKEEIVFIDTYLKNHDVIFLDIRYEMIDHIASAVEEKMEEESLDFYDAFKNYMAVNRKELFKNNEGSYLKVNVAFAKTLIQPYNIILGTSCLLLCYNFQEYISKINSGIWIFILIFAIIITFFIINSKIRYYAIEQNGYVLNVIYFINLFINGFYKDFYGNYISVTVVLFLTLAFFIHCIKTIIKFRIQHL